MLAEITNEIKALSWKRQKAKTRVHQRLPFRYNLLHFHMWCDRLCNFAQTSASIKLNHKTQNSICSCLRRNVHSTIRNQHWIVQFSNEVKPSGKLDLNQFLLSSTSWLMANQKRLTNGLWTTTICTTLLATSTYSYCRARLSLSPKAFSSNTDRRERPVYRIQRYRHDPKTKLYPFSLGFCSTYWHFITIPGK